jgi:hypothetical protein
MIRGNSGKEYVVETASAKPGFEVSMTNGKMISVVEDKWKVFNEDGVYIISKDISVMLRAHGWQIVVTRKPVYNYISGPSRTRYDIKISPISDPSLTSTFGKPSKTCFPHGLIGQGWDNGPAVDGARDDYTYRKEKPEVVTKAMAEGAIEGVGQHYEVSRRGSRFLFSRYESKELDDCVPRNMGLKRTEGVSTPSGSAGVEDDETR